jgi:membrane-associated phospholipid phosphatase
MGFSILHVHYSQVAGMPSEHAAYPFLFFLFLRHEFGRPAYLALLYVAGIVFAILYLGQHYLIDAVVGFLYVGVAYTLVMCGWPAWARGTRAPDSSREHGWIEEGAGLARHD